MSITLPVVGQVVSKSTFGDPVANALNAITDGVGVVTAGASAFSGTVTIGGGTDLSGAWVTWTPTLTNLTLGNGTQIAVYQKTGKRVDFFWKFILGSSGSAVGTAPTFTLPFAPSTDWAVTSNTTFPIHTFLVDAGTGEGPGAARVSGSVVSLFCRTSVTAIANITATVPFTWTTGDGLVACGTYYTA